MKNYRLVLQDALFWESLLRTAYFVTAFVIETTLVGLGMALLLHQQFYGRKLLQCFLLVPWAMSRVSVGILWEGIYSGSYGVLNGVLYRLGLINDYIGWFKHDFTALNLLVATYMWNQAPFATLLFLAALQSIPIQLYMAAEVDRASALQKFRYVTLPYLKPTLLLVLILATVNGFMMLDLIVILTAGGPGYATTVVSWLGYTTIFQFHKFGQGSAMLYFLTLFCLVLAIIYARLLFRGAKEGRFV
jgi:ABC-type sugar transport system permease subunit